ncbi:TetR/AcrR family transcriptional regulator [Chloroflexia bacterium SDU3-3]|nr:TetR/AcrR family transcriptional regulator [Chloroflexia bacterium SDU3-3]
MEKLESGRRERKDMLRNLERVLEAANELFAERGSGVTMEEVARRAGVGVGTVYRRFPSKEHLFAAVSDAVCHDTRSKLQQATATAPDSITKLHALVYTFYVKIECQSALLDPAASESAPCSASALYADLHHMLTITIAEGQQQGMFAPGDLTIRAALCAELMTPRTFHHLRQITGWDAESIAEQVTQFMLQGLGVGEQHE